MVIIGLITLGTLIGFLVYSIRDRWPAGILFGIILACCIFLFSTLIIGAISECLPESMVNVEKTSEYPIIALKYGKGITGSFYLFSTHMEDGLYYHYAYQTERGYKVEKVKADQCYIVYTEENPRIEKYTGESFKTWVTWIYAFPRYQHYILYVPEGTITTEFSIDLE